MAITNGYTTLAKVRLQLNITSATVTANDAAIELAVESSSRMIDEHCNRRFFTTAEDQTRYFNAATRCIVYTDDILSITTLATDPYGNRTYSDEWDATDFDLMPYNADRYEWIEVTPNGDYGFPRVNKGVKVIGKFGYTSTTTPETGAPKQIEEACTLQAVRMYKRVKEAPFGVAGGGDMGTAVAIAKFDPDVELMLKPYVKVVL